MFLKLLIQIMKKEFFWKRTLSNKASDPKKLFLPGIHPVSCQCTGLQLRDLFKHAVEAGSEHNYVNTTKFLKKLSHDI